MNLYNEFQFKNPISAEKNNENIKIQKQFFDELMRMPGQKYVAKSAGYDFDKSFEENFSNGYRLDRISSDKPMKVSSLSESWNDIKKSLSEANADMPLQYSSEITPPVNNLLKNIESAQGTPLSEEYKKNFLKNIITAYNKEKSSDNQTNTEPVVWEASGNAAPSNSDSLQAQPSDPITNSAQNEVAALNKQSGEGLPQWYTNRLTEIRIALKKAEQAKDLDAIAKATEEEALLNKKYEEYKEYPSWGMYYMDKWSNDYDAANKAKDKAAMESSASAAEELREKLELRKEIYDFSERLGKRFDDITNWYVAEEKKYLQAIKDGDENAAAEAYANMEKNHRAMSRLKEYYSSGISSERFDNSWQNYYPDKFQEDTYYLTEALQSSTNEEERLYYQQELDNVAKSKVEFDKKIELRNTIAEKYPQLLERYDEIMNWYAAEEANYVEAKRTDNAELAEEALANQEQNQKMLDSLMDEYAKLSNPVIENSDYNLTNSNAGIALTPKYTNHEGTRTVSGYQTVIGQFDVSNNPRYEKRNGNTYCNIFVADVMAAMGVPFPFYLDNNGVPQNKKTNSAYQADANGMCSWLETQGPVYNWRAVSADEAQSMANKGYPVVAGWNNPKGIGHIAVVTPQREGEIGTGVKIAQAGKFNFEYGSINQGFGSRNVVYYVHD